MLDATVRRHVLLGLAAAPILALGCTASSGPVSQDDTAPTVESLSYCGSPQIEGMDVSKWNGTIDWHAAAADGIAFAFIKATQSAESLAYVDPTFHDNWSAARSAGVIRSPYHFFDATIDGVAQAEHFLATVGTLADDDLPPVLDLECPTSLYDCRFDGNTVLSMDPGLITQRALDFLRTVEQRTGKRPMVYSYRYWFSDAGGVDSAAFADYPLFFAAYASPDACVTLPAGWSKWTFRQYDDGTNGYGRWVDGVGMVDLDRFDGSLSALQAFARAGAPGGGTPPPSSGTCPLGDGLYCGQNHVGGSSLALYDCEDGALTRVASCPLGCEWMPDGQDDRCFPGNTCPLGNGLYCGENHIGGNPKTLYRCTDGQLSKVDSCANGCERMPDGYDDRCRASGGDPGGGSDLGAAAVAKARTYLDVHEYDTNDCNMFSSALGRGCEQWCADFVDYVWREVGIGIGGLDHSAISFYDPYGTSHGTWKEGAWADGVKPGDAVVWAFSHDWAEHVGMVTEVHADGTISTIHGNFFDDGPLSRVSEVRISRDDDVGTGAPIIGYASPAH